MRLYVIESRGNREDMWCQRCWEAYMFISEAILAQTCAIFCGKTRGIKMWCGHQLFVNWWFGFLGFPYERDCYFRAHLESQTNNPNQQLTISWWSFYRYNSNTHLFIYPVSSPTIDRNLNKTCSLPSQYLLNRKREGLLFSNLRKTSITEVPHLQPAPAAQNSV